MPLYVVSFYINLAWGDMDVLRVYHIEGSKSEREKQISYINTYMWNL